MSKPVHTPAPISKLAPFADVDARLFRAAAVCASTETVRSYLCGVRIERHPVKGALLIATDGHRLVVLHDDGAWCRRAVTVPLDRAGLDACRTPKKFSGTAPRVIVEGDGTVRVGAGYVAPSKIKPKNDYPDWRKVVPVRKWSFASASFSAGYLADFGKIAELLGSPQRCIRVLIGDDQPSPALILFPDDPLAFGLLMPMKADVPGDGVPAWMQPVMKAKRPAMAKASKKT